FVPGLIELIAQAEIEGESGGRFEIILNISREPPLAVPHDANSGSNLIVADPVQHKVRRTITRAAGETRVSARITKCPEKPEIGSVEVVLLVAGCLPADGQVVPPALPGQVVVVVESVVPKNLGVGAGADITGAVADALPREARIQLGAHKRDANLCVTGQAEISRWVGRDAVVPTHARKTEASFVDDGRGKGAIPSGAKDFRWIHVLRGEKHGYQGGRSVPRSRLGVEGADLVRVA